MKKIFLLVLFSIFFTAFAYAETITLRADIWCPYNCDTESDHPGFMVEIAKYAFKEAGFSVDYQLMNWARAIEETRRGNYDGIIGAYTTDAPDFIFPPNEQGQAVDIFYTPAASAWRYESISSLSGISVGIIMGYSYGDILDDYIQKNPDQFIVIHGNDAFERNIGMLFLGRTTAFIANQFVMNNYNIHHPVSDHITESGIADIENVYIAFSPANPRSHTYAEILSKSMDELRTSGRLSKILFRYGLSDWKSETTSREK